MRTRPDRQALYAIAEARAGYGSRALPCCSRMATGRSRPEIPSPGAGWRGLPSRGDVPPLATQPPAGPIWPGERWHRSDHLPVYRELDEARLGRDLQADAEGSGRDVEKVFASGK